MKLISNCIIALRNWLLKNGFIVEKFIPDSTPAEAPVIEETPFPKPFNYGLDDSAFILLSNDYGWTSPVSLPKKYILVDLESYKEKVCVHNLVCAWRETGHSEWEYLLAGCFIKKLLEAYENGAKETDISMLFDRDLLASRDRVFTKEQIYAHIIPFFTQVKEDDESIYLRLNLAM